MRLQGKVAVVTGGGQGIGKAVSLRFSQEGARVVVNDVARSYAEALVEKLEEMGREALAWGADVSKKPEVEGLFEKAAQKFGRVDILVNTAGVRKDIPIHQLSEGDWEDLVGINLKGSLLCCQAAQHYMVRQKGGKIVNLASPLPPALSDKGPVAYTAASAGVIGLTKALAVELGKYNINVNCIVPEYIDTEMTRESARQMGFYLDDYKAAVLALIPLRRLGTPEEVAGAALFLASDESSYISGQVIGVKGGP